MVPNTLFRAYLKVRQVLRLRHWRGHGIHSPFTYTVVRQGVMKRRISDPHSLQHIDFKSLKIPKREEVIIKNIFIVNHYQGCVIIEDKFVKLAPGMMYLITKKCCDELMIRCLDNDVKDCCIIIAGIDKSKPRYQMCKKLAHECKGSSLILHKIVVLFPRNILSSECFRVRY